MAKNIVIGDADGLIALISKNDIHHQKAKKLLLLLADHHLEVYFPTTTIAEAITTLRRKLGNPTDCQNIIDMLVGENINLVPTSNDDIYHASKLYEVYGSKQNTFFDAIVAAIAEKNDAIAIFSFDKWYKKKGLKLLEDLE